jgi:ribonuclease BN (tRNA processing enzyme)
MYVKFFEEADLLVFDAQYTFTEALDKADWGHSSALVGAEFARRARIKRLALFHHDPTSTDEKVWAAKAQAEAYLSHQHYTCEVLVAYDGLHVQC